MSRLRNLGFRNNTFGLGGYNCILSTNKNVPQGALGWIKLYFEPEKRPAGAFWAGKIVFWAEQVSRRGLLGG